MYIQLSKNSFVRIYADNSIGYITNQLSKYDCAFNEIGADFLKEITRSPKSIEDCVNHLATIYGDVSKERIKMISLNLF